MIERRDYRTKKRAAFLLLVIFLLLAIFHKWQIYSAKEYLSAGDREFMKNNYGEALRDFNYAASLDGERDIIYLARIKKGEIFYKYGQFDKAREEILDALNEKKDDYRAYDILGDVYYGENKFNEAATYYDQAIQVNDGKETSAEIIFKKAKSFMSLGKLSLAHDILSGLYADNVNIENKELIYYLGLLDFNSNYTMNDHLKSLEAYDDFSRKIEHIKNFIKEYDAGDNKDYNNVKCADLYNLINEPWLAIGKAKEVIGENKTYRDGWIVLGKSDFIAGEYAYSISSFNKALELDKNDSEIFFWLESVYRRIGNQKKADEYLDKYQKLR